MDMEYGRGGLSQHLRGVSNCLKERGLKNAYICISEDGMTDSMSGGPLSAEDYTNMKTQVRSSGFSPAISASLVL